MKEFEDKINTWLQDYLIPRLTSIFNKRCSFKNIEYTVTRPKASFFLSDLFFVNIRFPGQEKSIVVKLPPQDYEKRSLQNYDYLFDNEILFYEKIANNTNENYPEYYLGGKDILLDKVIVMENVCNRGYFNSLKKVNLPLDYIIAGLKSIARFHGHTYAMKEQAFNKYSEIVKNIIDSRFDNKDGTCKIFIDSLYLRTKRVTQALRNRNYDSKFTEQIEILFKDCLNNIILKCIKPVEPLATIIHGDCTINNMLFRRSGNDQTGSLEAMLVDFGLIMYSSPALDVATFVYMCCSRKDIKELFEEVFRIYYTFLVEYLKERAVWNPNKYSYDVLLSDYRRCAIFGYIISCFLLPTINQYDMSNDIPLLNLSEINNIAFTGGGEAMSNLLVDMLIDMREAELLNYYINNDKINVLLAN